MTTFKVRGGRACDYEEFAEAERIAWKGSEVPIISKEQFLTWLEVFPEGLLLVETQGKVCGHHFSQIREFDVINHDDNRSWDELTENGFCRTTHDLSGNVLYGVSVSASVSGAGRFVFEAAVKQTHTLNLARYVGACRIPGLSSYAEKKGLTPDEAVSEYISLVLSGKLRDKTLSALLSVSGVKFVRPVPRYFTDAQSNDWACLICYEAA
ncbi:MAG: hypothetical protein ACYC5G_03365 [Candidatus Doudnabacteria bacterium]